MLFHFGFFLGRGENLICSMGEYEQDRFKRQKFKPSEITRSLMSSFPLTTDIIRGRPIASGYA